MMRVLATVASICVLLTVPAAGQEGNPAFMTPDTGPKQPNNTDRVFVHAAAIGGMAEVEFGKLAQEKGQNEAVKEFGRRMVDDHSKANDRLAGLAKDDGIPVPDELDQEHKAMRDRLTGPT
jgi:putative membrane protein